MKEKFREGINFQKTKNRTVLPEEFFSLAYSSVAKRSLDCSMSKDKKEKVKKKKMMKKESTERDMQDLEIVDKVEAFFSGECSKAEVEARASAGPKKGKSRKDGTGVPEGFCIAHPKSVKKATEYFRDVHSRKLAELLEAFHIFDFDRDGVINREDLKKTFASLNRNDVENEEIDQMLLEGLNPLNFDAFVILLGYKTLDLDPEEVFLDALSNWDDHHQGLVPHERLVHDLMAWGDKFTEEEAISALADAPIVFTRTKEKMIDYVQFSEDLCGLRKMMQRTQQSKLEK